MATIRTLSVALLLALCFAACACAPAERQPTNRYISYAPVRSGTPPPPGQRRGCSAIIGCPTHPRQPPVFRQAPKAGATSAAAAAVSQSQGLAALPTDKQAAPAKGGAKAVATGSKGGYISRGALSRDKLCGRFGCPNPNRP